jgi:hypothetical protein
LGEYPEAQFVWDRLHNALDDPACGVPVAQYRGLLEDERENVTIGHGVRQTIE